jgi:hypothetical protein
MKAVGYHNYGSYDDLLEHQCIGKLIAQDKEALA